MIQCTNCGAPVHAQTPCRYCGFVTASANPAMGLLLCVCGLQATWRCTTCDAPVCAQHAVQWWRGTSGGGPPLPDPLETGVWTWALDGLWLPSDKVGCTLCRARRADEYLTLYRALPKSTNQVRNAVEALRAGIKAPEVLALDDPTFWSDLREALASSQYPLQEVWVQSIQYKKPGKPKTAKQVGQMVPAWRLPYDGLDLGTRADRPEVFMHPDGMVVLSRTNGVWSDDWNDGTTLYGFFNAERQKLLQSLASHPEF